MNTTNTYIKNLAVAIIILATMLMSACEDNATGVREASGPPQLDRVSLVDKDSTTATGYRGVQYVIWGNNLAATRSVTFGGAEASINPALATDQNIIVMVPLDAPFGNASDSVVVTNPKGSASLPFKILQPPPVIESFSPAAAGAGDIVTIVGTVFNNVESVFFGDTEAEIISSSPTEIQVEVPEGVVQSKITVITPGGEVTSESSFGFKYIVYDDALNSNWWLGGWSNTTTLDNTSNVGRGTYSIKVAYTGGYAGFQIGLNQPLDLNGYSAIKLSIYGGNNVGDVKIALNGNYEAGSIITVIEGEYINITIPLSELGAPAELTQLVIQEFSGLTQTIFIDDIGLI